MSDTASQDALTPRDEIVAILARETSIDLNRFARETAIDLKRFAPDTKLSELDIASIDLVQAIFAIETRFDIEIPPGIEGQDATVDDLIGHILALIEKRQTAAGAT